MKILIQRVSSASVETEQGETARIGRGFLVLVGVGGGDRTDSARWLAHKTACLRIFDDEEGRMNLDLAAVAGEVLAVSQFTLYGDCRRGNRPGFEQAAAGPVAREIYETFCRCLREEGVKVQTGVFGARMRVSLINDGPVTLLLEKK